MLIRRIEYPMHELFSKHKLCIYWKKDILFFLFFLFFAFHVFFFWHLINRIWINQLRINDKSDVELDWAVFFKKLIFQFNHYYVQSAWTSVFILTHEDWNLDWDSNNKIPDVAWTKTVLYSSGCNWISNWPNLWTLLEKTTYEISYEAIRRLSTN